jgi:glyoxylase-like metal-dependent hydrolase (beta-lactamase superfamily II)
MMRARRARAAAPGTIQVARIMAGLASLCGPFAPFVAQAVEPPAAAVMPLPVVDGVWLIPGVMRTDRQPDGNTVVFAAPRGLVVVDTGRHAWQREAIIGLARNRGQQVVAIVNTHWHLDHVSGNPALRQAYPQLRVYASNAIDGALTGFLAQSARESAAYLMDESIPVTMREDIAADAATVANGQALRPDVVIDQSGPRDVGGRTLEFYLAADAVTAGDVWLYDPRSKVAVLGDLVTLPAPFLDTACPRGWLGALQDVERTEFQTAIPGHGEPMGRAQVASYRSALSAFIDCAASNAPKAECAAAWVDGVSSLLSGEANEAAQAQSLATYYVDMLRANGGRSEHCRVGAVKPAQ